MGEFVAGVFVGAVVVVLLAAAFAAGYRRATGRADGPVPWAGEDAGDEPDAVGDWLAEHGCYVCRQKRRDGDDRDDDGDDDD